jgi:hypothetical protein
LTCRSRRIGRRRVNRGSTSTRVRRRRRLRVPRGIGGRHVATGVSRGITRRCRRVRCGGTRIGRSRGIHSRRACIARRRCIDGRRTSVRRRRGVSRRGRRIDSRGTGHVASRSCRLRAIARSSIAARRVAAIGRRSPCVTAASSCVRSRRRLICCSIIRTSGSSSRSVSRCCRGGGGGIAARRALRAIALRLSIRTSVVGRSRGVTRCRCRSISRSGRVSCRSRRVRSIRSGRGTTRIVSRRASIRCGGVHRRIGARDGGYRSRRVDGRGACIGRGLALVGRRTGLICACIARCSLLVASSVSRNCCARVGRYARVACLSRLIVSRSSGSIGSSRCRCHGIVCRGSSSHGSAVICATRLLLLAPVITTSCVCPVTVHGLAGHGTVVCICGTTHVSCGSRSICRRSRLRCIASVGCGRCGLPVGRGIRRCCHVSGSRRVRSSGRIDRRHPRCRLPSNISCSRSVSVIGRCSCLLIGRRSGRLCVGRRSCRRRVGRHRVRQRNRGDFDLVVQQHRERSVASHERVVVRLRDPQRQARIVVGVRRRHELHVVRRQVCLHVAQRRRRRERHGCLLRNRIATGVFAVAATDRLDCGRTGCCVGVCRCSGSCSVSSGGHGGLSLLVIAITYSGCPSATGDCIAARLRLSACICCICAGVSALSRAISASRLNVGRGADGCVDGSCGCDILRSLRSCDRCHEGCGSSFRRQAARLNEARRVERLACLQRVELHTARAIRVLDRSADNDRCGRIAVLLNRVRHFHSSVGLRAFPQKMPRHDKKLDNDFSVIHRVQQQGFRVCSCHEDQHEVTTVFGDCCRQCSRIRRQSVSHADLTKVRLR